MLVCYQVEENSLTDLAKATAVSLTQDKQSFYHLIARVFSLIAPAKAATATMDVNIL